MQREVSPVDPMARPFIEKFIQKIYDSVNIAQNIPTTEIHFFRTAIGEQEGGGAGVTSKSELHTNLDTPGQFSNPRLFDMHGIGITMSPFHSGDLGIVSQAGPPVVEDLFTFSPVLEDLKRIFNYSTIRFRIGEKDYVACPTSQLPGSYGAGGVAIWDDSVVNDAPGVAMVQIPAQWFSMQGHPYSMQKLPLQIPPQQAFHASMLFDSANDPITFGGLNAPGPLAAAGGRRTWMVVEGEMSREVQ